jgi:lipid-A-disaccharide synthase
MSFGRIVSFLRRCLLKVKYISLVNLVADKEVVRELVADGMTVENVRKEMDALLPGKEQRKIMMDNYDEMVRRLGETGAPAKAAQMIYSCLMNK